MWKFLLTCQADRSPSLGMGRRRPAASQGASQAPGPVPSATRVGTTMQVVAPLTLLLAHATTGALSLGGKSRQTGVHPCNVSDPMQVWEFSPLPAQASLHLKADSRGTGPSATSTCLNVAVYGKSVGDNVWVGKCHEEHPWKANDGWTFTNGQLVNTRSKLCATESQQQQQQQPQIWPPSDGRQASRHTVLGPCSAAQHWDYEGSTGLVKNKELGGCLTVEAASTPPPPDPGREPAPPFPNALPAPSTVRSTLVLGGQVARSGGSRYASFNFDWHCGASDAAEYNCRAEPGWNHSSVNFGLDLSDPALVAAAKALAPGRLRIGGSQGDCICYDIPAGSCAKVMNASGTNAATCNSPAFILNMSRWQQIVDFATDTGIELVFGLNGATRTNGNTPLDWEIKNTRAFVEYGASCCLIVILPPLPLFGRSLVFYVAVSSHNAKQIYGFELGNGEESPLHPLLFVLPIRTRRVSTRLSVWWWCCREVWSHRSDGVRERHPRAGQDRGWALDERG
eukprot:SAG25_NODE_900_length_4858_cov_26.433284_6_plen_510_part_00